MPVVRMYENIAADLGASGFMRPGGLALTKIALSKCSFLPGARVLDVGCGAAGTVEYLIGHHFNALGVDPSPMILRQGLERNASLPLMSAVGEDLPFADSAWDGVFFECILSITRDPERVLGECRRILKNNGRLVLSDLYLTNPSEVNAVRSLPSNCCLAHAMTRDELLGKLNAHDFQLTFWEDHSPALKAFIAQLIFSYGSAERFWWRAAQDNGDPANLQKIKEAITRVKPGYFLLIAQKSTRC
jgi:arsenite methyltransferase